MENQNQDQQKVDSIQNIEADWLDDVSQEGLDNQDNNQADPNDTQTSQGEGEQSTQQQQQQSQEADPLQQLMSESERAKHRLQEYEQYDPMLDRFQNDPQFQRVVQEYMYGARQMPQAPSPYQQFAQPQPNQFQQQPPVNPFGQQPGQYQQPYSQFPNQQQTPKPPEDFDPYEMSNPQTPSGKWFQQVQQQALTPQLQQFQQMFQQYMQTAQQQQEEARLEQMRLEAERQAFNDFRSSHNDVDEGTARNFWNWVNDPRNVDTDILFKVYQAINQTENQSPPPANEKVTSASLDEAIRKIKENEKLQQSSANLNNQGEPVNEDDFGNNMMKEFAKSPLIY